MILIDDRKGSGEFASIPPLDSLGMVTRLDSGDFCFSGHGPDNRDVTIGIELKSLFDLVSSRTNGRLQGSQLPAMLTTYDYCYLVYYGSYRLTDNDEVLIPFGKRWTPYRVGAQLVRPAYLCSILAGVRRLGVDVIYFPGGLNGDGRYVKEQIALWLAEEYRWWDRPWDSHSSLKGFDRSREVKKGSLQALELSDRELLCANAAIVIFPKIGLERAKEIAKYFGGSIRRMINAHPDEIASIIVSTKNGRGREVKIGSKIAKRMNDVLD